MTEYTPELGQAAFSNGGWERHDLYGDRGYQAAMSVAGLVAYTKIGEDPTDNVGAEFRTSKFALRSYCWCEGDRPGHEDGCPPNFEMPHRNLSVRWYKHAERSPSANRPVSRTEWLAVIKAVLTALDDDRPGRSEAEIKAEALREAADEMRLAKDPGHWNLRDPFDAGAAYSPDVWLERRAARVAEGTAFDSPPVLALLDRVAELEAKVARMESLRQAAEVVVLDAGDEATGPEPDPNLAELAHCVAALAGEADIKEN